MNFTNDKRHGINFALDSDTTKVSSADKHANDGIEDNVNASLWVSRGVTTCFKVSTTLLVSINRLSPTTKAKHTFPRN